GAAQRDAPAQLGRALLADGERRPVGAHAGRVGVHRRKFERQINPDTALVFGDAGAIFWWAEGLDRLAVLAHTAHMRERQRILGPPARALETTATSRIDLEHLGDAGIRAR